MKRRFLVRGRADKKLLETQFFYRRLVHERGGIVGNDPDPRSHHPLKAFPSTGRAARDAADLPEGYCVTLLFSVPLYALATCESRFLEAKVSILETVPIFLISAACLILYGCRARPRAMPAVLGLEATSLMISIGLTLACLSYLSPMIDLPLRDRALISIDKYMGLDWLQVMLTIDSYPHVLWVLKAAYATFTAQLIVTVLAFMLWGRVRELDLFFVTFIIASLIAELASLMAPTLGPMFVLGNNIDFVYLPTIGRKTGAIVEALRDGTTKSVTLSALDGIISFPSLHATVAVLVPYSLRWNRWLFISAFALNIIMLLSVVPCGNHYLADMVGGLVVAAIAIAIGPGLRDGTEQFMLRVARKGFLFESSP
jgi:membrane-associated phospholipid phosphatase